jgi:hypothetical protein
MKKNLLLLLSGVLCIFAQTLQAQTTFKFQETAFVGALDADAAKDWTKGWTNWDPKTTAYAAPTDTTTLNGIASTLPLPGELNITTTLTLDATKVYLLRGLIVVRSGGKLVIPAGTLIRCLGNLGVTPKNYSTIVVERGGQIDIQGTAAKPVVFTSSKAPGQRDRGDWGGIVLSGRARNNQQNNTDNNNVQVEGFNSVSFDNTLARFGGTDDNDNSGSIKYCRLEFGGFAFDQNREINGLTMGSVGAATVIDYVQVSFGGDDAFEWFGGTVNGSHLISYKTTDDDFDTDFGYSGLNQFGLAVRDTAYYDLTYNATSSPSTSEGFESDNEAQGTSEVTPNTRAVFSNFTMVGPVPVGSTYASRSAVTRAAFRRGARIRRNSSQSIVNSVFMGYRNFIMIDGDFSIRNTNWPAALATTTPNTPVPALKQIYIANNLFVNTAAAFKPADATANGLAEVASSMAATRLPAIDSWLRQTGPLANKIDPVAFTAGTLLTNPSAYTTTPDFRPVAGSPALSGANFRNNPLLNGLVPVNEAELTEATVPVYPNPIGGGILNFGVQAKQFYLVNLEGEIVKFGKETDRMDTDGLAKGMYFIVIDKTIQKVVLF